MVSQSRTLFSIVLIATKEKLKITIVSLEGEGVELVSLGRESLKI